MRFTRGLTLIEMLVVSVLMAVALVAVMRVISASANLENRSQVTLRLSLRANAEMERLKTLPYEELTGGTRELENLPGANDRGEVTIRSLHNDTMKEITITMTHTAAKGFRPIRLVTLVAKPVEEGL
jgi:prepilin-type N-terminal cleavage/methylation domain-containing protein